MRWIVLPLLLLSQCAWAQWHRSSWLHGAYTYNDLTYKESGRVSHKGVLPGARGELGLNLFGWFAVSGAGEYASGYWDYDGRTLNGTQLKDTSSGYVRHMKALGHIILPSVVLSAGVAERYWYDDLDGAYRRRTQYRYYPVALTIARGPMYLRSEHVFQFEGRSKTYMSDLGGGRSDVEFQLGDGKLFSAEIGFMIPSPLAGLHVFASYQKWTIGASDTQNDGVAALTIPSHTITVLQGGLGFAF